MDGLSDASARRSSNLKILRVTDDELLLIQDLVDAAISACDRSPVAMLRLQRRIHDLTGEEYWPGQGPLAKGGQQGR